MQLTATPEAFATAPAAPTVAVDSYGPASARYAAYTMAGELPAQRTARRAPGGQWSDLTQAIAELGDLVTTLVDDAPYGGEDGEGLFEIDTLGAVVFVDCDPNWSGWRIKASAPSATLAAEAVSIFLGLLPAERVYAEENAVMFHLWMAHPMMGAVSRRSTFDLVPWESISLNYPASLRAQLSNLCTFDGPPEGGRLGLFHGPPGTGKTRFLQTLATEWAPWCDMHYVLDPEEMFKDALYLNAFLQQVEGDRWSLLVLEDGDEFIDVGAKSKVGQGLSRLLNMADGFIGQATKTMVLISTNVEHESFHPAAIRDGRCFTKLEFPEFTVDEAVTWFGDQGAPIALEGRSSVSLAELYAMARHL